MSEGISIEERAARYISKIHAVSGSDGHGETFKAACAIAIGFDLDEPQVTQILSAWNVTNASPAWSEKEIAHKVRQAMKAKLQASGSEIGSKLGSDARTPRTGKGKSGKQSKGARTFRTFSVNSKTGENTVSRTLRTTSFLPTHMRARAHIRERDSIGSKPSETSEPKKPRIKQTGDQNEKVGSNEGGESLAPLSLVRRVDSLMGHFSEANGGTMPQVVRLPGDVLPGRERFMGMRIERVSNEEGVSVK